MSKKQLPKLLAFILLPAVLCAQEVRVAKVTSGKVERNLNQAQISIDLLEMLSRRTAGNLSEDESRLLARTLQELKLNYVDETLKDQGSQATS